MPLAFVRMVIVRVSTALRKSAALVVNSGALAIGTAATAVLGFAYWWLAARLFPPEAIGRASALLSVMGLVGLLGEAGLGTLLIGEIGRHRDRAPGLVGAAACVGAALALGLASLYVFVAPLVSSTGLIGGWIESIAFVLGCGLTVLNAVALQALVGNLNSTGRMIQQVLFSLSKLMLIAAAAAGGYASNAAILLTWVAGLLTSWIGYNLLTRGGARRLVGNPDFGLLRALRGKVFGHYALDVTLLGPGVIMPYLVLVLLSPTINAAFASLWMLVSMAALIPAVTAMTLFPLVRANPAQFRHDVLVSLTASLLFSLVCAAFVFLFSREILVIFNPAYPEIAGSSLRFLGFGLFGLTLKFHACALARLGDWMSKASFWFALGGSLELCAAVAGAKIGALQGLVVGWTLAVNIEGACALLVFGFFGLFRSGLLGFATKSDSAPGPARAVVAASRPSQT